MKEKAITKKRRGRPSRWPGICQDAAALGVSRIHLWYVLSGKRVSARLMRHYKALKGAQAN